MGRWRIGTRGSKLALIQANRVKDLLEKVSPKDSFELVLIKTEGDIKTDVSLKEIGGKGVFVREIEKALIAKTVDFAVHSLKDVTSELLMGLELSAFLKAEAFSDALILRSPYTSLKELPEGACIATGSARRRAILKKLNPRITFADIRGNVDTRLKKLIENSFDGLMLSEAGLMRLGLDGYITERFSAKEFCPAPGQGVIVVETRQEDRDAYTLAERISDPNQSFLSKIELAFLEKVGFDCKIPLGLHARCINNEVYLQVFVSDEPMENYFEDEFVFSKENCFEMAKEKAVDVKRWMES